MADPQISSRPQTTAAVLVSVLACLAVGACGGAAKNTASTNALSARSLQSQGGLDRRFQALRECLQKHGVTLPKRSNAPGVGGFLGAGQLPKGVSRTELEAALRKCGGLPGRRAGAQPVPRRFNTPAAKRTLARFVTCMRGAGVDLPSPNTSGKGPVFDTRGLNPTGARFRAAQLKCNGILRDLAIDG